MIAAGLPLITVSTAVGVHRSTLQRWVRREDDLEPLARPTGPPPQVADSEICTQAIEHVRQLRGLVGVESLRHSFPMLTRRAAREAKQEALRQMEAERRAGAERITILAPGAIRGFDAMHLKVRGEPRYLLTCADAAIPYRTSWLLTARYTAVTTAALLKADFAVNGAPLVLRLDRASQHAAPEVDALLRGEGVLSLHGPPHYPPFYGQLERQNREHRAWLSTYRFSNPAALQMMVERMMRVLNELWRRPSLHWLTSAEAWAARAPLKIDRRKFRKEVVEKRDRIRRRLRNDAAPHDLADRLAIEQTLARYGLLRRKIGGWC